MSGTGWSDTWWGQLVEKVLLWKVACFIYIYKKEVSFGQAIAGVGGMPGSLREDPRAARVS